MTTLLVLSTHPEFARAVGDALAGSPCRVVHRLNVEEAEPLLAHGLAGACVMDAEFTGLGTVWAVERLRRLNKTIPLVVYSGSTPADWEEEAVLRGVNHVLSKPVRPRMLAALMERLRMAAPAMPGAGPTAGSAAAHFASPAAESAAPAGKPAQTLDLLRGFSPILTHSLDAEAMLRQFLQFLRETLSINRAAVFLNRHVSPTANALAGGESRRLIAASAVGIGSGLLDHFELSLDAGIGLQVTRLGRIVRRDGPEVRGDPDAQKEFELLGAQVAVPVTDRRAVLGVAVFDGRITGEPLVNAELEMVFHLLEQLGLALNNIWLHDQLASNHAMMAAVLRELDSACVVVGRDLRLMHANNAARRLFVRGGRKGEAMEFPDLPPELGAKAYQVLKTGAGLAPFRHALEDENGTVLKITIVPFQHGDATVPVSALLVAEDLTESEQLGRLETEAARLRLRNDMAYRLVNEIGNAVVPLDLGHQLLKEHAQQAGWAKDVDAAFDHGIPRIKRLKNQMHYLSKEGEMPAEAFDPAKAVEEAYQEAARIHGSRSPQLKLETSGAPGPVRGNRASIQHALAEILLNAIQASPPKSAIRVRIQAGAGRDAETVAIEVEDAGGGFTAETAREATEPFYSRREGDIAVGLGLTVSRKIVEQHRGRMEIRPSATGLVRVVLPADSH